MKKTNRLLSLLIALLFHLSIFFILHYSKQYSPTESTITRVSLLNILSEPTHNIHPPMIPMAKTIASGNKSQGKIHFAPQKDQLAPRENAQENQTMHQQAANEQLINGLDAALGSSTASSVSALPMGFSDKKPLANLKAKPEEKRTALAKEMEKAVRPDCKTAYQNLGIIIAPLALLHDTVRDKGCQW